MTKMENQHEDVKEAQIVEKRGSTESKEAAVALLPDTLPQIMPEFYYHETIQPTMAPQETVTPNRLVFVDTLRVEVHDHCVTKNTGPWHRDSKGSHWRILFFPTGNQPTFAHGTKISSSVFLEWADPDHYPSEKGALEAPRERHVCLNFAILHSSEMWKSQAKDELIHKFSRFSFDWGHPIFMDKDAIFDPDKGYCKKVEVDGRVKYEIRISVMVEDYIDSFPRASDSKKKTGMVGLKNQGATCYMNSLLQSLYHLRKLRKAVYNIPCSEEDRITSVSLAMQRIFYYLQTSDNAVATKKLTRAFQWERYESFLQQDIQEFNRVLCDRLEEKFKQKMKDTESEHLFRDLFEGKLCSYIKCINVEYESSREETYWDLQLQVRNCKNLEESFEKYMEVEMLEGDNQYDAEGHGKQDARKGVDFVVFPPVLNIHLKRFEYDLNTGLMRKINDHMEFPQKLDMKRFVNANHPEKNQGGLAPQIYHLHSILVHSGDVHGGHYYAFINPHVGTEDSQWYKFDDDIVTKVSDEEAVNGSFGNSPGMMSLQVDPDNYFCAERIRPFSSNSFTSAYMLVYIRASDLGNVMVHMDDSLIPEELVTTLQTEEEEEALKEKERQEQYLYTSVTCVADEYLGDYDGYSKDGEDFVNLEDDDCHFCTKIKYDQTVEELLQKVGKELDVPATRLRCWTFTTRENKTFRVDEPLEPSTVIQSLKPAVYVEVRDEDPIKPLLKDQALVFLKFYDPRIPDKMSPYKYLGNGVFDLNSKGSEVLQRIKELIPKIPQVKISTDAKLKIYECITPNMVDEFSLDATLKENEIQSGDVIVAQVEYTEEEKEHMNFPSPHFLKEFLQYRKHRKRIVFLPLRRGSLAEIMVPSEEKLIEKNGYKHCCPSGQVVGRHGFSLELSANDPYASVLESVAKVLEIDDPNKIRLQQSCPHDKDEPAGMPYSITSIEIKNNKTSLRTLIKAPYGSGEISILYFEILPFPLEKIELNSGNKLIEVDIIDSLNLKPPQLSKKSLISKRKRKKSIEQHKVASLEAQTATANIMKFLPNMSTLQPDQVNGLAAMLDKKVSKNQNGAISEITQISETSDLQDGEETLANGDAQIPEQSGQAVTAFVLLPTMGTTIRDVLELYIKEYDGFPSSPDNLQISEVVRHQVERVLHPEHSVSQMNFNSQIQMGYSKYGGPCRLLLEIFPDDAIPHVSQTDVAVQIVWHTISKVDSRAKLHSVPMTMVLTPTDSIESIIHKVCKRRRHLCPSEMQKWPVCTITKTMICEVLPTLNAEPEQEVLGSGTSMLYAALKKRFTSAFGKHPSDLIDGPPRLGFLRPNPNDITHSPSSGRALKRHNTGMTIRGS